MREFQNIPQIATLVTIYKCLIKAHHDYGKIIYD